jgi:DNA (cytosine-5)-methyltransferase 1
MLVLSLFPGIGLLDRAFEAEGFCVVRGPDLIWGGDIRRFYPPPGRFEGVIGGPPCQKFSTCARLRPGTERENLIPEFERCVYQAQPEWFLMENVRQAPIPQVDGYLVHSFLFNNRWLGEEQNRVRRFTFGSRDGRKLIISGDILAVFENPKFEYCVTAHDHTGGNWDNSARGKGRTWREMARLQGLPPDFDIPPFRRNDLGKAIGNGVPLPMGRAVAKAVKQAINGRFS